MPSLFTIPQLSTVVASTSQTVNDSFTIFFGIGLFILGIVIGTMILLALIRVLRRATGRILAGSGGGRGRGRRRR